jgi:outer membrane protein
MIRIMSFFLLVVSLTVHQANAQRVVSLSDCLNTALKNSTLVKNSQLDLSNTQYQIAEIRSSLLPSVDLSGQYNYYFEVPIQLLPASTFGGPEDQYTEAKFALPQTATATLQLNQVLYNQKVFAGLKAAKVSEDASHIQLRLTKEEVAYNVSATYFNLQVQETSLASLRANLENIIKTVAVNKGLNENGLLSDTDYKRLIVSEQSLRNQCQLKQSSLDQNYRLLKYLLHLEQDENIRVEPILENETVNEPIKTGDIQLQKKQLRMAEISRETTLADYYPSLTFSLSTGYSGYNSSFAPLDAISDKYYNTTLASINLRVPVFDGFSKRHLAKQARLAITKQQNALIQMERNATKEILNATANCEAQKILVKNNRETLKLAEEIFNSTNNQYVNGLENLTVLLQAQNDLSDARSSYTNALANYKLALLELRKANGELINKE